jgi:menaquinone-dependent protoporphyrinogen oxidase
MRVLVTAASKHGGTWEIAEAIREQLATSGLDAVLRPLAEVEALDDVDAVVLGSGVYAGRWLEPARRMASTFADELRARPVWLFSSGPIGEPPMPEADPADVEELLTATAAVDHRVFPGRLERRRLGFAERAVVAALRAPDGDFRDWDAVAAWSAGIVRTLEERAAPSA